VIIAGDGPGVPELLAELASVGVEIVEMSDRVDHMVVAVPLDAPRSTWRLIGRYEGSRQEP